jgi:hypothetical protein
MFWVTGISLAHDGNKTTVPKSTQPITPTNYPNSNQLPNKHTFKIMTIAELKSAHTQYVSDDFKVNNHEAVTANLEVSTSEEKV